MKTKSQEIEEHLATLCALVLYPRQNGPALIRVLGLGQEESDLLLSLAQAHHVVMRAISLMQGAPVRGASSDLPHWVHKTLGTERARIDNALEFLSSICSELEAAGCPMTVIKSLDHWPDLGNDLDLYTDADTDRVIDVLKRRFQARLRPQSWGDRLANKWNFTIPGLVGAVEIHTRRLGQMGEHTELARRFATHTATVKIRAYEFRVPAGEERVIAATLQRMYRHFYIRICDILNTATMVETGALDYDELREAAGLGGIWPGVATYLNIVSAFVQRYRGKPLPLPESVTRYARLSLDRVYVRGRFFRIPIVPEAVRLYASQMADAVWRGDLQAAGRLSLLPPLASVAAVTWKLTGSNRGIW